MAYTTRELPSKEWARLTEVGAELGPIQHLLTPETTRMLVVEDAAGAIVGSWALMCAWHVEGLWIAPAHQQRGSVGRRLLATMRHWIRGTGAAGVVTGSVSPLVDALLTKAHAERLAPAMWVWPVSPVREADAARGARFHQHLHAHAPVDAHPDDPDHDVAVGVALRLATEWGPERASAAYNAWATGAGYQAIQSFREVREGVFELQFATQRMQIGLNGAVFSVEECSPCP
jgi:hypothetical protein